MSKEVISRKASDNTYFHKDFHIVLNFGIEYLYTNYGIESVREYLTEFADSYYSPLKESLIKKGLIALKNHYEKIYRIEGAEFKINFSSDKLDIYLFASPAVMHIKSSGQTVSPAYKETILTINKAICRNTPFECEMVEYNSLNGAYQLSFYKRAK